MLDGAALVALSPLMIARQGGYRVGRALSCGIDQEYGGPLLAYPGEARLYVAAVDALHDVDADVLEIWFIARDGPLAAALSGTPQSWVMWAVPARWRGVDGYSIALSAFAIYDDFLSELTLTLVSTSLA